MKTPSLSRTDRSAAPEPLRARPALVLLALSTLLFGSAPARAIDGCQVLLCLAAPSWRSIPQCVPTITQLFRDLARGKPFPSCAMSGAGNSADHSWATAPSFCPAHYTRVHEGPNGPIYACDYVGAVSVTVDGTLFSRTWWTLDGTTSTEFSPAAKSQLQSWDTRFDDDYDAWLRSRPPVDPIAPTY